MYINLHFDPGEVKSPMYVNLNMPKMPGTVFPIAHVGKDSYIVNLTVETALDFHLNDGLYNFQIGNYSSLAENILLLIDMDHNYKSVYQGVISEFNLLGNISQSMDVINKSEIKQRKGEIIIGNDCWIGNGSTIMGGVIIHDGAVVAAKSVVTKSVPPYTIVGGNPAIIIKKRFDDEMINALKMIRWWNWGSSKLMESQRYLEGDIKDFVRKFLPESKEKLKILSESNPYFERTISKGKVYLYIVDDDAIVSSFANVISQFCNRFNNMDSQLVLFFPDDLPNKDLSIQSVIAELNKFEDYNCLIDLVTENSVTIESLINHSDAYITSRSSKNIQAIGVAELLGKQIVSGFNLPIMWIND